MADEESDDAVERLVVADAELMAQVGLVERGLLGPLADPAEGAGTALPEPAAALAALRRVREAVSRAVAAGPRVWAPNSRWEHAGLRLVSLEAADTDLLYATLRALSGALVGTAPAESGLARRLVALAAATGDSPAALVGALARSLAAVDLVPDADTDRLAAALRAADDGQVRLTAEQEAAWQRLAHRVTMLLTESAPLHRFLG
ncbi:hypothetical protein ACIQGZ_26080 [Streptomyces sp. NPDC092296]|uniref:hypothetical protein n=1 Tax=Streptomyces sp. NPDC092296 TaxID=3366012 RepID=UPI00380573B4